mgnify:CR=1 FL=1
MNLRERLDRHKAAFEKKAPPEALAVMHRATADLQRSGMVSKALGVGDQVPHFTLDNQDGASRSIAAYLGKDPLVLGFYRGRW